MKQGNWKGLVPFVVAIVAFFLFAVAYCSPLFEGRVLQAGDTNNYLGASQEVREYSESEGRQMWWTNSMFGGMPSYQISGQTPANKIREKIAHVSQFGLTGDYAPAGILMGYLFGFFLMLICFGVSPWFSIAGAFALTLSSYFMLIIPAGHITKANAICCLAPVIGGFYAIFRRRYWLGIPLVVIYGVIGLTLHPQMTYYVVMLLGVLFFAEIFIHVKERQYKELGLSTLLLAISLLLVFGTKLSWYQMNQSYLNETMRGGHSELTKEGDDKSKPAGLDFKYATDWSYGKAETLTLLIPNYMGGASGYNLGDNSELEQELKGMGVPAQQARGFCHGAPTYWGEKMFTSGPVYVGAIICFLFVLGLIIVPGAYKWALLIATLFSVTLAWGRNLTGWTQFFYDYFPMYNKFRAVESILIVAEITIPLLGFLAIKRLIESNDAKKDRRNILIAGGVTGLICLFVALFGGSFDVTSSFDEQWKGQVGEQIYGAILNQRHALMTSSAWRSFFFVLIGVAIFYIYTFFRKNEKSGTNIAFAGILAFFILCDMVTVDRNFFGKDNFVTTRQQNATFEAQPWEEAILQDKSLDYRVFNLAANTFNDARTSYRLKSIGGYSAAKLRRYQDLIDAHITKNNWNVLNMLNTKYIITQQGQIMPNPDAMGNAWFVDSLQFVANPDLESEALRTINLKTTAVADQKFAEILNLPVTAHDSTATITLDSYVPDRLSYTTNCAEPKVAVFSEIYFPEGWHLYVDDKEQEIGRVNYTLRAAVIPAGQHTVRMEFVPDALQIDKLCVALVIFSIILTVALLFWPLYGPKFFARKK